MQMEIYISTKFIIIIIIVIIIIVVVVIVVIISLWFINITMIVS